MSGLGFPWVHFGLGPKFVKAARIGAHLPHTATDRYGPVNCDVLSKYTVVATVARNTLFYLFSVLI